MKTKLTLITLVACAAAGSAFAADPVRAFRADSGTWPNSGDAVYVGNDVWGQDSQAIGEKYFADLAAERGGTFSWDPAKDAFYVGIYQGYSGPIKEYWSFDTVFALDGNASFVNEAGATLTFRYSGDKCETDSDYDAETGTETYFVKNWNTILLAGISKFSNAGTLLCETRYSGEDYNGTPPYFEVYMRDNAVFENSGRIKGIRTVILCENAEFVNMDRGYISPEVELYGNAKFVNAKGGEFAGSMVELYGNSVFENAGTADHREFRIYENAKFVNTGLFDTDFGIIFESQKSNFAGTAKFENRGEMATLYSFASFYIDADVNGEQLPTNGVQLPTNLSASFENYGTIAVGRTSEECSVVVYFVDYNLPWIGDPANFEAIVASYKSALERSDFNVKNFGKISGTYTYKQFTFDSGVKLTLGEGSTINGDVAIGTQVDLYKSGLHSIMTRLDKDVLNIVLTGEGGSDALISGDLELSNHVELNVSLAEDAVKKTKYELSIWGGDLTGDFGFLETAGTFSGFGTTYEWILNTATGTLTAKDVNIGEEIDITSSSQNVALGKNDVATFAPEMTEYSGRVSGAGQVSSSGNLEFRGNASALTGMISIDAGTFTVAENAKLGKDATLVVAGTLAIQGARTIENATSGFGAIELSDGATVTFAKDVGVKNLNVSEGAVLKGGITLTNGAGSVLTLAGTLALDAAAGEKVALGNGKAVLESTAKLSLGGNAAASLESGARVVIFENGKVEGPVLKFLETDPTLAALATESTVIYDATNGLSVQSLKNPSALAANVDTSGLSASFLDWALGSLEEDLADLSIGFVSKDELDELDLNDMLLNVLFSGDAGTARAILDRLSPKSYAAMIAMPVETLHDDVRSVSSRLEQRRRDAAVGVEGKWEFFAQAQMISVENDTASDAPTFDFDRYGALAGADVQLDETMLLGVAVGAGTGEADIHNGGGKIESTDYRAVAYFGKTFAERFYVNAGAQLGFASYDVKRRSDYGDANADVDGWNAGVFAETGATFAISEAHRLYATPYVGLAYTHAETDSFTESGSGATFVADALEGDSLRARIGCAFSWDFALASTAVRLGLDVAYSRELLDDEIDVDVTASDGSRISETAAALPEDVFSIGPTLDVALTASASVYAGYAFNAGTDSSTAHSANVGFRLRF